ncbi:MAG: hypothetical protein ACYC4R_16610 [Anaerolineae bacterium]
MDDLKEGVQIPDTLRQALSLILTVLAAVLYAAILGSAVVRTYIEVDPTFGDGTIRAAGVLSGLVGAVVAAGFANSQRAQYQQITLDHPLGGGQAPTGWTTLKPPSRLKRKLLGLARTIGVRARQARLHTAPDESTTDPTPVEGQEPETPQKSGMAVWVAILYFAVYFIVGAAAFALAVIRPEVPELVSNCAWVWLGAVVSSGYTFFELGQS